MEHRPVYCDPQTGQLKFANFANSRTRYWGTLEWDPDNDQWVLRRKNRRSGKLDAVMSGRGTPDSTSSAQLIIDRMSSRSAR